MNLDRNQLRSRAIIGVFALAWVAAVGVSAAGAPASARRAVPAGPSPAGLMQASSAPQASGVVGDDTCTACHESEGKSLRATLHGKAQNARTPAAKANQSCETCHGPGREHAESGDKTKIKVFTAMAPKDINATCLACHSKGAHGQWNGGMHDARNLSCASCHSVH
ncbi:MAG: hypothetical protein ABJA98_04095, partial [Acidobacteriota bacterium]